MDEYLEWKFESLEDSFGVYLRELTSIAEKGKSDPPVLAIPLTLANRDTNDPTIPGIYQSEIFESHHDRNVPFKCHSDNSTDYCGWSCIYPDNNHKLVLVRITCLQFRFGGL